VAGCELSSVSAAGLDFVTGMGVMLLGAESGETKGIEILRYSLISLIRSGVGLPGVFAVDCN